MLEYIINWLFPHFCCLCREEIKEKCDICSVCKTLLPWAQDRCYRCGLRLKEFNHSAHCQKCFDNPFSFDRLCPLFDYIPPARNLVTGLKFSAKLNYGRLLGELLADKILTDWYRHDDLPQALMPVPLHIQRLKKRGYNQATELIWPLQRKMKLPILIDHCIRTRSTKPQSALPAHVRKFNVQQVFKIVKPLAVTSIAIIDDVVTTASTVNALSLALKGYGVERVDVWCICR